MVIHVLGLIGSGKTTISEFVSKKFGFDYINSDNLSKEIYFEDSIINWIKVNIPIVLNNSDSVDVVDRSLLRSILFKDYDLNKKLLSLSIPIIKEKINDIIKNNPHKNYIIESFAIEVTEDIPVDMFIYVKSSENDAVNRVTKRDHRPENETKMVLDFQKQYYYSIKKLIEIKKDNSGEDKVYIMENIDDNLKTVTERIKNLIKSKLHKK